MPAESPWTEEPCGLQSWGPKKLDTTEQLDTHMSSQCEAKAESFWLESVRWKWTTVHLAVCVCVCVCVCDCVKEDLLGHRIRDALRLFQITIETDVLHFRKTPLPPTSSSPLSKSFLCSCSYLVTILCSSQCPRRESGWFSFCSRTELWLLVSHKSCLWGCVQLPVN